MRARRGGDIVIVDDIKLDGNGNLMLGSWSVFDCCWDVVNVGCLRMKEVQFI